MSEAKPKNEALKMEAIIDRNQALEYVPALSSSQFGRMYRGGVFRYHRLGGKVVFRLGEFLEDLDNALEEGHVVNSGVNDWKEVPFLQAKRETDRD